MSVFVDWAASAPLTGLDIHSDTVIVDPNIGVDLPPENDDDGLAGRNDARGYRDPRVVHPLALSAAEPV